MRGRMWRRRVRRHHVLRALLARMLQHLLALRGTRVEPLLSQHLATRWWQLLKAVKILPYGGLLVGRQRLEALPALAYRMTLLRRELAPMRKPIARLVALGPRHTKPALAAMASACWRAGGSVLHWVPKRDSSRC